jgi:hypothetical protein
MQPGVKTLSARNSRKKIASRRDLRMNGGSWTGCMMQVQAADPIVEVSS